MLKQLMKKTDHDFASRKRICMGLEGSKGKGKWCNYNHKNIK